MEISVGDLVDRFSIIDLKIIYLCDGVRDDTEITKEWCTFQKEFVKLEKQYPGWNLKTHFEKLREVNAEIWRHESDLRQGKLEKYDVSKLASYTQREILQFAAVGLSAIKIRDVNRKRKQLVNDLVELTETGFKEIKIQHASEGVI